MHVLPDPSARAGELDYEEFRRILRKNCGLTEELMPDEDVYVVFSHVDADMSGTIELHEFKALLGGDEPTAAAVGQTPERRRQHRRHHERLHRRRAEQARVEQAFVALERQRALQATKERKASKPWQHAAAHCIVVRNA